jgi:hypothetical protein
MVTAIEWLELKLAGTVEGPYGTVLYADSKNKKYPIDTKEHAKAAWGYINQADNAAKYPLNGVTLESVKGAIKKACEKYGVEIAAT